MGEKMEPNRKRPTRSQAYQHLLVEKAFSHEMMESFPEEDSLGKRLNPWDYNEDILVLEDQLKERFWEIIEENLTERQLEIINLLKQGFTQSESARALSINQSSITKSLHGNSTYDKTSGSKNKESYGGIVKKITKIANEDKKVREIMAKIAEIRTNSWL